MPDVRWILLGLGSLGATGCMPGTTLVPGDPTRFDPVARLPSVADYAGPSTKFLALVARYVREDGTINLEARYIKSEATAVYYAFVRPQPSSDDTDVPLGVPRVHEPKVVAVFVSIHRSEMRDDDTSSNFYGGMERETGSTDWIFDRPDVLHLRKPFDTPTPPPRCHFGVLWAMAKDRGAPAGAVAVIVYDPTGYRFRIDGTPFKMAFDTACNPKG